MDIYIQKVTGQGDVLWLVTAGSIQLRFHDQHSALDFSTRLKERVEAPHDLPGDRMEAISNEPARAAR